MKRIDHSSAAQDLFGAGKDGYTNGTPSDPASGTIPQADALNHLQEEIANAIEDHGIALDAGVYNQLYSMLVAKYVNRAAPVVDGSINSASMTDTTARLIDASTATDKRLWLETKTTTSTILRIYTTYTGFEFTCDALWNGTNWTADGNFSPGLVELKPTPSGEPMLRFRTGFSGNDFTRSFGFAGDSDDPATVAPNTIYAGALPRVVASVSVLASSTGTVSGNSQGVSAVTANSDSITVEFTNAFTSSDYFVSATLRQSDQHRSITLVSKAASECVLRVWDASTVDGIVNPTLGNVLFDLIAIGLQ